MANTQPPFWFQPSAAVPPADTVYADGRPTPTEPEFPHSHISGVTAFYDLYTPGKSRRYAALPVAFWSLVKKDLQACNQEFLSVFEYAPSNLRPFPWTDLCLHSGRIVDPALVAEIADSGRKLTTAHVLMHEGKLTHCTLRLTLLSAMNNVVTMLLTALTISDGSTAQPTEVMWIGRRVPANELRGMTETNLDEFLSKLQLESTESRLVEVKRKKPVPTEARKPWDDKLAKFSLKRQKMKPAAGGRRSSVDPGGDDTDERRSSFDDQRRMSAQYDGRRPSEDGTATRPGWYSQPSTQRRESYVEPSLTTRPTQEDRRLSMDETALRAYSYAHPHAGVPYAPPNIAYRSPYVYAYPTQGAQPAPMQTPQNVPRAPPTAPYAAPQPSTAYLNQARHMPRRSFDFEHMNAAYGDRRVSDPLPVHTTIPVHLPPRPMAQGEEIYFPQVIPHVRPQEAHPDSSAAPTAQPAPTPAPPAAQADHLHHGDRPLGISQIGLTTSATGLPTSGLGSIGPAEEMQIRQLSEDFFRVDSPLPFGATSGTGQ